MSIPRASCIGALTLGLALAILAASTGMARAEAAAASGAADDAKAPSADEPKTSSKAPAARKPRPPLTEEEVKQLPPLTRFDIPIEKGKELLKDVKDETFGYDESAFYYIVEKVRQSPADLFKPDAEVTPYRTLMAMPSSYRGQPVTIRGIYMTAAPFSPPPLALWKDVHTLYECSIREHPLNEHRPIATVIVIDDPMTYLRAGDDVRLKGYFYKVRTYDFRREDESGQMVTGTTSAPLLVARRLEAEAPASPLTRLGPAPSLFGGDWTCAVLMVAAVVLLGGAFFYLVSRARGKTHAATQRPVHRFRLRRPDRIEPPGASGPGDASGGPKP